MCKAFFLFKIGSRCKENTKGKMRVIKEPGLLEEPRVFLKISLLIKENRGSCGQIRTEHRSGNKRLVPTIICVCMTSQDRTIGRPTLGIAGLF